MKRRIFIDLDGVVIDTISTIVGIYNEDHAQYKNFRMVVPSDIKTWDFDELELESREYIDSYFNQPRFFKSEHLKWMMGAKWIINKLYDNLNCKIIFCSSGSYPNLQLKRQWIYRQFHYADFIPVEMPTYEDKSHVDMSGEGTVFIDDCSKNLITSNAETKICFGEIYSWNEDWNGIRCRDWTEIYKLFKGWEG